VYEKHDFIGGTLSMIATVPFKKRIRELINWYDVQLKKLGVKIVFGTEVTADDSLLEAADRIIVATGSDPIMPPLKGIDGANVVNVVDAHHKGVKGEKIVICGGGLSGCDAALELAMKGKKVTVIEMLDECAQDAMPINMISLMRMLAENNVTLMTNSKVIEIDSTGIVVEREDGTTEKIEADTVVVAVGQTNDNDFVQKVMSKYYMNTTVVGDAEKIGKAGNAIRTGLYAAMAIE